MPHRRQILVGWLLVSHSVSFITYICIEIKIAPDNTSHSRPRISLARLGSINRRFHRTFTHTALLSCQAAHKRNSAVGEAASAFRSSIALITTLLKSLPVVVFTTGEQNCDKPSWSQWPLHGNNRHKRKDAWEISHWSQASFRENTSQNSPTSSIASVVLYG